jgi:formylglycine-generating enzyme required for sulfatase activity
VVRCLEANFLASFISVSGISTVVFIWLSVSRELSSHQVFRLNQSGSSARLPRDIASGCEKGEQDTDTNHVGFRLVCGAR